MATIADAAQPHWPFPRQALRHGVMFPVDDDKAVTFERDQ